MAYFLRPSPVLGAWIVILAAETHALGDNTTTDTLVGWTAASTTRGTYTLIWSCLSTIFACTWTILHLNVPGLQDGTLRKFLRKLKWMVINMLFPEFVLSKAVCDLRLALDQLRQFDEFLHERRGEGGIAWTTTEANMSAKCTHEWEWKVKYPQWSNLLYQLLALELPLNATDPETQEDKSSLYEEVYEEHSNSPDHSKRDRVQGGLASLQMQPMQKPSQPRRWKVRKTQRWTVVHSYYAQMGGLLYLDLDAREHQYFALTASKLTTRYRWEAEVADFHHPLMHLVLSEQDIQDKSKADWLAKGLAVLQITWLVVNLIARGVAGLPITQLEIATAAFAVVAILTYIASWWKPKDISQPTILHVLPNGVPVHDEVDQSQSLTDRLLSPTKYAQGIQGSKKQFEIRDVNRVRNDSVWLEGDRPLLFGLMAVSSLIFGSLHFIAWNYEFPSLVELLCWRVASLTSTFLPVVMLALSLILSYISSGFLELRLLSNFRAKIQPWNQLPDSWWQHVSNPSYQTWSDDALSALLCMPPETRNWNEEPSAETVESIKTGSSWTELSRFAIPFMRDLPRHLPKIRESWQRVLEGEGTSPASMRREELLEGQARHAFELRLLCPDPDPLALWDDYEAFVRKKLSMPHAPSVKHIVANAYFEADKKVNAMKKLQRKITLASRFLTIFGGILYALARLTIMVLIFSCLRATPERAYQNTPWIHFIPNIS